MFRSKREQRRRKLRDWPQDEWDSQRVFMMLPHVHFRTELTHDRGLGEKVLYYTGIHICPEDPQWREKAIEIWLDETERDSNFARQLDQLLGLHTDAEDQENHAYWNTIRNKGYLVVCVASLILTLYYSCSQRQGH